MRDQKTISTNGSKSYAVCVYINQEPQTSLKRHINGTFSRLCCLSICPFSGLETPEAQSAKTVIV